MIVAFMPYVATVIVGYYRIKQKGIYDITNPRRQASELVGPGERALNLHQNCWEALILFSVAIGVNIAADSPMHQVNIGALVFVALRVIYFFAYLADHAKLRLVVFEISLVCCFILFVLALTE
jgi:uncharacterized MAPEG superfamily protein